MADAETVGKLLVTPQRTLNPTIVGKSAAHIANLAGIAIPDGTRCLLADCAGVGRDFPWSIEKLSPTLGFFVVNGVEEGANRCLEILRFGGMGHTAGMHTQDRAAAIRYGELMPAARVIINSPTTHGAIGFSTDLPPSMTLGCGSWGGNVTSDNVSPIHLIDVKRVAFETKPVNAVPTPTAKNEVRESDKIPQTRKIKQEDIAAIVDSFLRTHPTPIPEEHEPARAEEPAKPATVVHHVYPAVPVEAEKPPVPLDFVSEDDVRTAIADGKRIHITKKSILTPSARDLGEEKDIFTTIQ
ncbi:MAG: hypothetical protein H0X08_09200 [Blastocatellia bacterium]|nr:hypothetical protein [Blastocatellia bacterium]